ncbi:MAG: DNA translocase FtsK [Clostridia bacterium]|nr:DNA translocase FtsK [Clostridia bacterium]
MAKQAAKGATRQPSKSRAKKAPARKVQAYSSDATMVRMLLGFLLIAFGILLFLSVLIRLPGALFPALRTLSWGLCGVFCFLLPAIPIWSGILLILSLRRKVSVRPLLLSLLLLGLLCALGNLLTYSSFQGQRMALPDMYAIQHGSDYVAMLQMAYTFSASHTVPLAGGMLGMLLLWPFWAVLGSTFTSVLFVPGALVTLCFLTRFNAPAFFQKLFGKISGKLSDMRAEAAQEEAERSARQLEWQKQQASQQVLAPQPVSPPSQPWPQSSSQPQRLYTQPQPATYGFQETPEEHEAVKSLKAQPLRNISKFFGRPAEDAPSAPTEAPPRVPRERKNPSRQHPEVAVDPAPAPIPDPAVSPTPAQTPVPHPVSDPYTAPQKKVPEPEDPSDTSSTFAPASGTSQQVPVTYQEPVLTPDPDTGLVKPKASWVDEEEHLDLTTPVDHVRIPPAGSSKWNPTPVIRDPGDQETFGGTREPADEPAEQEAIPYLFPGTDLLCEPEPPSGISQEEDQFRAQRLEETLASFKVEAHVRHITHGPTISRFELELAQGIKVAKVTDLGANIAMNMAVKSVRIEAPIPGTSLIGVEVPNRKRANVTLLEVLQCDKVVKSSDPLLVPLGRDIAGTPVVCNLAKMPHLLIAGATGSGKSVCINTIITSLLYRCSPDDVRLILVDPKVVELQCYNGIPHLLAPVVSDPHKASGALQWVVEEMMKRYNQFREISVRNIDGYNAKLPPDRKKMPRMVVIIDELADLMMVCKREVEESICRIAQLARAAGIHLVVATQRPSVDVITGLIKANIPSRIAFKVSSFIDSRTILDKPGAEQLLGYGDMLYQPMGEFSPVRVQGCFLRDEEVNAVADFIRSTSESDYDPDFVERLANVSDDTAMPSFDLTATEDVTSDGSLLQQCIEIALQDGQVSTSLIQRRLKIGYARAGRLVDEMEKQGIISAKDGAKPRICLISREEYEQRKSTLTEDV